MQESHAVLVVEFTGPSVSDGTLCTDRLAPSLLALSDALRFLNRLVNPDGVEAGLSVTKAEGGRFELGLWVWRTFENQIACLADGVVDPVPCPAGLLADCLVEILALKKWLEGGTDAAFAFNPAIGGFEVTAGDRHLAVSGGAWIGFRDDECGAACSRVAASLSTPGVDAVLCLSQNRAFELAASGRAAFERSLFVRQLTDAVMTFTVLVDSAGMLEGRRIRVSLGEHHSFTAVMKDDAFNSRIVAGDILVVDLRVVLHMAGDTLLVEREIVKVREHRPNH